MNRFPVLFAYACYAVGIACLAAAVAWVASFPPYVGLAVGQEDLRPKEAGAVLLLFVALTVGLLFAVRHRTSPLVAWARLASSRPAATAFIGAGLTLAACLVIALVVLDAFPNSGDEYAYLQQACLYAKGRLWADAPPLPEFFQQYRFVIKDRKWVGWYPPGWPMLLAFGHILRLPEAVVNPVLATASVLLFLALARGAVSACNALLATVAFAGSAFFLFNAGSFFNHVPIALGAILTVITARDFLRAPRVRGGLVVGALLGVIGLMRPDSAVMLAAPLAGQIALTRSRLHYARAIWILIGGLPFLLLLLLYFYGVTGNPLLPVPNWFEPGAERAMSAGEVASRYALKLLLWRMWLLAIWTSPLLLLAVPIGFVLCWRRRALDFADFVPVVVIGALLFYPGTGGNQYGPRYYFVAFGFMLLTVAKAIDPWLARQDLARGRLCGHLLAAHLVTQTAVLPFRAYYEGRVVYEREELYRKVTRAGLVNAVVLVSSPTGWLRPLPFLDLLRNGVSLDRPIIYARDLPDELGALRRLLPGRPFYRYEREHTAREGSLSAVPEP